MVGHVEQRRVIEAHAADGRAGMRDDDDLTQARLQRCGRPTIRTEALPTRLADRAVSQSEPDHRFIAFSACLTRS